MCLINVAELSWAACFSKQHIAKEKAEHFNVLTTAQ